MNKRKTLWLRISLGLAILLALVACHGPGKETKPALDKENNPPDQESVEQPIKNPEPAHTVPNIEAYARQLEGLAQKDPVYAYVNGNKNFLSDKLLRLAATRREALPYVEGYLKDQPDLAPLSSDFDLESPLPLYFQWDRRWGYLPYANGLMGTYGCAPTSIAMVLTGLGIETFPQEMAQFIRNTGNIQDGYTSWKVFDSLAGTYPLEVRDASLKTIQGTLSRGGFGILSLKKGNFTTDGHMVALAGLDGEGKYIINDPNSYQNSRHHWTYEELQGQVKHLWALEKK